MRRLTTAYPALAMIAAAVIVMVAAPRTLRTVQDQAVVRQVAFAQATIDGDDILLRIDRAVTAVADKVRPSVVHIDVSARRGSRGRSFNTGSGWVYDDAGHIITNAHVVRDASRVTVEFSDGGRTESAEVVGIDTHTDIAILKIDPFDGIIPADRATDVPPRQGQRVFAFGSPFGFKFSMAEGIISGLGRTPGNNEAFGGFTNFIQSDAAVNPGNSGGPLSDASGRVIGMNVSIATGRDSDGTNEGDSAGISFAIPLATIENVAEQIIGTGEVARGYLGVSFDSRSLTPVELDSGRVVQGVAVGAVQPDQPADRAGLRDGDRVVAINGSPITEVGVFMSIIGTTPPGKTVALEVARRGEILPIDVTLGQMPAIVLANRASSGTLFRLGIGSIQTDEDGAEVRWVVPGSPADEEEIRPGTVISAINGKRIRSQDDLVLAMYDARLQDGSTAEFTVTGPDSDDRRRVTLSIDR